MPDKPESDFENERVASRAIYHEGRMARLRPERAKSRQLSRYWWETAENARNERARARAEAGIGRDIQLPNESAVEKARRRRRNGRSNGRSRPKTRK